MDCSMLPQSGIFCLGLLFRSRSALSKRNFIVHYDDSRLDDIVLQIEHK